MSFIVTLVRHGQTEANVQNRVQTFSDNSLTEAGQKQAKQLGAHLTDHKFTKAYSSDLKRTQETAKEVFETSKHEVPELVVDPRLRERSFGEIFEGRPNKDVLELAIQSGLPPLRYTPPGGETYEDVLARISAFFTELCETRDNTNSGEDEHVVIFTHGLWILLFFQHVNSKPEEFTLENFEKHHSYLPPPNTGTTKLKVHPVENGKRRLEFLHIQDTSHLSDFTMPPIFNLTTKPPRT